MLLTIHIIKFSRVTNSSRVLFKAAAKYGHKQSPTIMPDIHRCEYHKKYDKHTFLLQTFYAQIPIIQTEQTTFDDPPQQHSHLGGLRGQQRKYILLSRTLVKGNQPLNEHMNLYR